jgi:hypothetical protein
LLNPHVEKLVVCNPRKNALLKDGNKNDRIDARKLAELLRGNQLKAGGKQGYDYDDFGFLAESVELRAVCDLYDERDATVQRYGQGDSDLLRWHDGPEDYVPERRGGQVYDLDADGWLAQHHGDLQRQCQLHRQFGFADTNGKLR